MRTKYNVRVNTITPGYMSTEMTKEFFMKKTDMAKIWVSMTPMGRPGEPQELGGIVIYLASEASSYTTGQFLP